MLIGLMSDTHDNLPMVDRALQKFNSEHVELVLHAGDYVAGFVIPRFQRLNARLIGVFGNNDGDHALLKRRFSENKKLEIRGDFAKIDVENRRIALLHGNEELLSALTACQGFDFVIHGHTHNARVDEHGKTLIINPGEVCGYLTNKSTVGFLDTQKSEARIIEI